MTVKAILARKGRGTVTIDAQASLAEAARLLADRRIGCVIVKAAGDRISGLLSERDIVRVLAEQGPVALALRVEQAMTRQVVTCVEADTIPDIMERMTTGKFRHVPVVEAERLIGVISIGDVVKYRLEQMEAEQSAMIEYIATA